MQVDREDGGTYVHGYLLSRPTGICQTLRVFGSLMQIDVLIVVC
jgi:hypothetical protein